MDQLVILQVNVGCKDLSAEDIDRRSRSMDNLSDSLQAPGYVVRIVIVPNYDNQNITLETVFPHYIDPTQSSLPEMISQLEKEINL